MSFSGFSKELHVFWQREKKAISFANTKFLITVKNANNHLRWPPESSCLNLHIRNQLIQNHPM